MADEDPNIDYRPNGRPKRGVSDNWDESSSLYVPNPYLAQQLSESTATPPQVRSNGRSTRAAATASGSRRPMSPKQLPATVTTNPDTVGRKKKLDHAATANAQSTSPKQLPAIPTETPNIVGRKNKSDLSKPLTEWQVSVDDKIEELEDAGTSKLSWCDTRPKRSEEKLNPPSLDLDLLKLSAKEMPFLNDDLLLHGYIASNAVLPCLKQFEEEVLDFDHLCESLDDALSDDDASFTETTRYLAQTASQYSTLVHQKGLTDNQNSEVLLICAKFVRRLKRCTMQHFMYWVFETGMSHAEDFVYTLCARAILTMHLDLKTNAPSFFSVMIDSRYAEPMVEEARLAWDRFLVLPGSVPGANTANSVASIHAACVAYANDSRQISADQGVAGGDGGASLFAALTKSGELHNTFLDATANNPKILTEPLLENGQTKPLRAFLSAPVAPVRQCDSQCNPRGGADGVHTTDCFKRFSPLEKEYFDYLESQNEAVVPDQQEQKPSRQRASASTVIPPDEVPTRFNYRDDVDPFSAAESLAAFKRMKAVLEDLREVKIVSSFQWSAIAEVLPGRGVVDCINFYYANKIHVYLKVKPAAAAKAFPTPTPQLQYSSYIGDDVAAKIGKFYDVDKHREHFAELESNETSLRIEAGRSAEEERAAVQSEAFHKKRADGMANRNERLEERHKEHVAGMEKRAAEMANINERQEERHKEQVAGMEQRAAEMATELERISEEMRQLKLQNGGSDGEPLRKKQK